MAKTKKMEKTSSTANIGFEAKLWQADDKPRYFIEFSQLQAGYQCLVCILENQPSVQYHVTFELGLIPIA
jgi:hypothetical protein